MRRSPHLDLHGGDLLVKRFLVAALSLALAGTATACNSDSTGPGASLAGTYTLRTVNNQTPPVTLCDSFGCFAVLSGQLQLDASGNFVNQLQLQNQGSLATTQTTAGYWVVSGNQISLVDNPDNVTLNGTATNSTITIIDTSTGVAVPLVYTR
jgi:hypothetical protein